MNVRTTWLLLLLVLGLGAFIAFFERKSDSTERSRELAQLALRLQPDAITRVRLVSPAFTMELAKQGDGWRIMAPLQAPADDSRIEQLLLGLALLPRSHIVTEDQLKRRRQKPEDFGFDQPRWRIATGNRDTESMLLVGRDAPTGESLYLQVTGRNEVIVVPTNLLALLPISVSDFRDRRLVPGDPEDVARLELRSRSGFVQLSRTGSGDWTMVKPVATRTQGDVVKDILKKLHAARIVEYVASSTVGASLYGLDEPVVQCAVQSRDGAIEKTILLGKQVEGSTNLVYATRTGEEEIFTVDRALLDTLARSAADVRDRRLLPLPPARIAGIAIEVGEDKVALERTNGAWFIVSPRFAPADALKVQLALSEWTGSQVRRFDDEPGTNLAALGFVPPARKFVFRTDATDADAELPTAMTCLVSSVVSTDGTQAARFDDEGTLRMVDTNAFGLLRPSPLYFRDPVVLAIETGGVRGLTFERAGRSLTLPFEVSNAPPAAAEAVLRLLRPLRARTLVTEDTRNLQRFGLQPPEATLAVGLTGTGGISRIVVLGTAAPDGGRYAMVMGQDLVFTIDGKEADELWRPIAALPAP